MKKPLLFALLIFISLSCITESEPNFNGIKFDGTGYKPIYSTVEDLAKIQVSAPQPLVQPGKIYVFDPYIFINESGKGIHIIDNSDPKNPQNLSFIAITGNYDMAVKGNWLYADNLSNLLVFDISDPKTPKLAKTIADAIPVNNYPPFNNIYFECAESKKGIVVGWEKVPMSEQPKCFR
ncbi:hypothetical protein [Dyadobacter arcticus]|uniref:LVIVD repeat-containing protein n=1 Tax=Dyadobacter arcticus TaxID=1078754 RepID=A0ABX0UPS3_9BACT|nr:hypothetical protein [Dyadobacter arcticus]NIJ54993.1 hypothetical protein [Dyadobacter arcticus]